MACLSNFPSFAKVKLFSFLLCFVLAAFVCVSLGAPAFAKSDHWMGCRGADIDARITSCTEVIGRGSRETTRNRITAYINRSGAYRAKGDFDRALANLDEALRLDPKSALALLERASIYHAKGEFDRAIADYDGAIAAQPKSAAAFSGRGETYRAKNDLDRAIADYDKALQLDENLVTAYGGRAGAYRGKGDLDKALADFDEAVKLDPKSALTHVDRGAIYQAEGDLDRAIADYDEAIEIDPNYANAFLTRANAYRGKHDLERAKEDLEAALRLDPQLAPAKDALDEVNRLIAKSAAPLTVAAPTVPAAPAANPILLVLLMLIALIGLFAIVAMHFFAKPVDKSLAVADDAPKRYRENLQGEVDGAALYRTLADVEADEKLAEVYRRLAAVEDAHAEYWRGELRRRDARIPRLKPSFRSRALGWLARRFGPAFVLPTINTLEQADSGAYDHQPEAVKGGLPADERSHARILEVIASPTQGLEGGTIARLEGRHRAMGGNALRAAVLGANDGLVSNMSLVMGVAGANADPKTILLTGLAGLVAGACSMALGEWLSVNSSRELYEKQISTEKMELEMVPEEEKEELVLIYQAKGLKEAEARALADRLLMDKTTALDTLAREELGLDPNELGGSPWTAAGASFFLFSVGAIFPVAPYFWLEGTQALVASLAASAFALALIGSGTSLFTGRSVPFSAMRQILIGFIAAGITYGVGKVVGVSLGG